MSFIHLSTIQPTDGQQEVTDRTPSFIKNDFKNGILLKQGETIELVALRLAFDRIEIIEGVNDTMYFMLGDAPNFCQVEVKLAPGNFDEVGLGENLQTGLNSAINIPSFAPQLALDPTDTANPLENEGCVVTYVPATAAADAKYTITWNQQPDNAVADTTLGSIGKAAAEAFKATGSPPTDPVELAFYKLAVMNAGAAFSMRLPRSGLDVPDYEGVFNGGRIDAADDTLPQIAPNTLYSYTDAFWNSSDYRLDSEEEVKERNVGNDFQAGFLSNQFTAQRSTVTSDREGLLKYLPLVQTQEVENPQRMEGLLDTEGKITLGASPQQGYSRTELMKSFGTSSVAAGPPTTIISELNRNSRTGMLNTSQRIDVPTQYHGHDVTQITLHLNNSSSNVINLVLDIYDSITDATSTNVAARFSGLTPIGQSQTCAVPPTGATGPQDFIIDIDTSHLTTFYVVLKVKFAGSSSGLSIQGNFGSGSGSNGNMLADLKHEVVGNTPAVLGATVDKEWTLTYNSSGDFRAGVVTPLTGTSADNFWDFRFDFTPALAPQNSTGQSVTRLYGVFSPTTQFEGRAEPGAIFWGVGTSTAANPGGTATPPPDAQLQHNWTFFGDKIGRADLDISRFCYQNEIDAINNPSMEVKGFYASRLFKDSEELEDYYRVPWDFDNTVTPPAITTPSFLRTDSVDVDLTLDTVLGYNPMRVGVNRRIREVTSAYNDTEVGDPASQEAESDASLGALGIEPNDGPDLCDYFIQVRNTNPAGGIKVDGATKAYIPWVQVIVLDRLETKPLYPNLENVKTRVVYEDFIDNKLTSFDPTQDLVLQVQVKDMTKLIFSAASRPAQIAKWDENNYGPESPAGSDMTEIYTTVENIIPAQTSSDTGTTQIKQSDYPLMGSITVGRGGHYPCKTQDPTLTKDLASYCWADGMLSRRPINPDNRQIETKFRLNTHQRKTIELWPKNSFSIQPTISGNHYELTQMYKFGRLSLSDIDTSHRDTATTPDGNFIAKYYVNSRENEVRPEYIESNNIANMDRIFGMNNLINIPKAVVINGAHVDSSRKVRTHPFTDVFNVELLSEPVKSHNGARGDVGKSIYTVTADELEIDTADRIVSFTPKSRLPVDLNLVQDKTVYSLTCAIKDVNNRIIRGLRPPSDITLYKSLPEGIKIQRAVDKLSNIMTGKDNDRNANKIDNIGESNPLLGVIPR